MSFTRKRVLAVTLAMGLVAGTASLAGAVASAEGEPTWQETLSAQGAQIDTQLANKQASIDSLTAERDALAAEVTQLEADLAACETEPTPSPTPTPSDTEEPPITGTSFMRVGTSLHRESGESYLDAWERRVNNWGERPEMIRYFYSGLPSGDWPEFSGAQTVVSFKAPNVAAVPSGAYDAQISEYLAEIPDNNKVRYLAFYHEPEDNISDGHFTKAEFRAAHEHIGDLIDASNAQRVNRPLRYGVILMGWSANPASGRTVADYIPATTPDFLGWDIYPGPNAASTADRYQMATDATAAAGVNIKLLTETAPTSASTQEERAAWIPVATEIADEQGFKGFMYFDSTVGGDFRLQSADAHAAMGEAIAQ